MEMMMMKGGTKALVIQFLITFPALSLINNRIVRNDETAGAEKLISDAPRPSVLFHRKKRC